MILICGLAGAARKSELVKLLITDVDKRGDRIFMVHFRDTKTTPRSFTISDNYYDVVTKYLELRPPVTNTTRFFIQYRKGRCIRQPIGENKFGDFPREIAEYLKLERPETYKSKY